MDHGGLFLTLIFYVSTGWKGRDPRPLIEEPSSQGVRLIAVASN